MSHSNNKALTAYILGELSTSATLNLEKRLASDPALSAQLEALQTATIALTLGLAPEAPPAPSVKAKLLESIQAKPMYAMADALARLCDVATETARGFIDQIEGWANWAPLMPGVHFLDVDGGPALAGARPGLVYILPGVAFPRHAHKGDEISLYLQGEALFDDGTHATTGDLLTMKDGSNHGFSVVSEEALIFAVVLGEIEMLDTPQ